MPAQVELELDTNPRACSRTVEANRITGPPRRGIAVDRPRDCLENGRLSGAVRPDDARDARSELHPAVRMLAEVLENQAVELHLAAERRGSASRSDARRGVRLLEVERSELNQRVAIH